MVRTFSPQMSPMKLLSEIPLKLTRKCLDMFGTNTAVDGETTRKTVSKLPAADRGLSIDWSLLLLSISRSHNQGCSGKVSVSYQQLRGT